MVEFALPKNSKITGGKTWPKPAGATETREFRVYRWNPDDGKNPERRHLSRRHQRLRADGAGRPDLDQEPHRPDADLPPLLPRRRLRLLRHEHRRPEHAGLHQVDARRERRRGQGQSAAAPACREGPGARPDQFLRAIRFDRAVAEDHDADAAEGMEAEPRGPRKARRPLRVHPVRLLLDLLPELLVEQRPLPGAGRAAAGDALGRRIPATRPPANGSTISKTRSGSTAATPS